MRDARFMAGKATCCSSKFWLQGRNAIEKYLFEEYFRKIRLDYQRLIIPIKIRAPPWIEEIVVEHDRERGASCAERGFTGGTSGDRSPRGD